MSRLFWFRVGEFLCFSLGGRGWFDLVFRGLFVSGVVST